MGAFSFDFGNTLLPGEISGVPFSIPGGGQIPIFRTPGIAAENTPTNLPRSAGSGNGTGFETLLQTGLGFTESLLGYKLLSQQIAKGQSPTITYDSSGRAIGVPYTASFAGFGSMGIWLPVVLVVIVLALIFKR